MSVFVTVNDNLDADRKPIPARLCRLSDLHPLLRAVLDYEAEHGIWHKGSPCPWKEDQ